MPKTYTKVITLNNFYGGIAEDDLDIYSKLGEGAYVQGADIFRYHDFLQQNYVAADDSAMTGEDAAIGFIPRSRGYVKSSTTNTIYTVVYGRNSSTPAWLHRVLSKTTVDSNWALVTNGASGTNGSRANGTGTGAAEPTLGVFEYSDDIYWFYRDTQVSQYSGTTLTDSWDNLNTVDWGGSNGYTGGAINHTDGNIYFWKQAISGTDNAGRYIGPYDGTTLPSAVTPFTLPEGYSIVDAISKGHYLIVAANDTTYSKTSKLFVIDPYTGVGIYTFDDIYDTQTYGIQALASVEGGIKLITFQNDLKIIAWGGGDYFPQEKRLNVGDTAGTTTVRRTAVDIKDRILYMGTNSTLSGFNNGIYAYGREKPEDVKAISNAFLNHSNTLASIDYRALKWMIFGPTGSPTNAAGKSIWFASWYNGTDYDMSRLNYSNATPMVFHSTWFRPWRNLRSQCIKATIFHAPLSSTDRFDFDWAVNGGSFSEIETSNGATDGSETILFNNQAGLTNNFPNGWRHKFRLERTDGSTLKIEAIKLKMRTSEQE